MIEFGALPPEINSGWMYTGPGPATMLTAATAWRGLAAELGSTAAAYQAVVARVTGELWTGSASASMAAAAALYVAWMGTTAASAAQAASQATAAAAAFETAFAMTVPPPVIVANRSLLMTLVATNLLGQNTPAIAATEAQYAQMWAQDTAAMYGYAGASAAASRVTPFSEPGQVTNPAGLAQLMSTLPATLQTLASPLQSGPSSAAGTLSSLLDPANLGSMASSGGSNLVGALSNLLGIFSNVGGSGATPAPASAGVLSPAASSLAGAAGLAGRTGIGAVSAGIGRAGSIGMLSVPPAWAANATTGTTTPSLPGVALTAAVAERGMAAMPAGMPFGSLGARAAPATVAPSYGFRPTVTMHPVAAG